MKLLSVVIIGGGGHAKMVANLVCAHKQYQVSGYTDPDPHSCLKYIGVPYLGNDEILTTIYEKGISKAFMGLGGISNIIRTKTYQKIKEIGYSFPELAHPSSVVASDVQLGAGTLVMAAAVINSGTKLGENVLVNTGAIIEHDCILEEGAQIGPGAILCGNVTIKREAFVGTGACIIQGLTIGEGATIGAGSVVINDVKPATVVVGNPAKPI